MWSCRRSCRVCTCLQPGMLARLRALPVRLSSLSRFSTPLPGREAAEGGRFEFLSLTIRRDGEKSLESTDQQNRKLRSQRSELKTKALVSQYQSLETVCQKIMMVPPVQRHTWPEIRGYQEQTKRSQTHLTKHVSLNRGRFCLVQLAWMEGKTSKTNALSSSSCSLGAQYPLPASRTSPNHNTKVPATTRPCPTCSTATMQQPPCEMTEGNAGE